MTTRPTTSDPVLPVLPRTALLLWFVAQWIVIPLETVLRVLLLVVKIAGDAVSGDGIDPRRALARATSVRSLRFQMSHDQEKRRTHLERKVAKLAEEIHTQRFSLSSTIFHAPRWKVRRDSRGLTLHPRDYRGLPQSTIDGIIESHGLRRAGGSSIGHQLQLFEGQLWEEQTA